MILNIGGTFCSVADCKPGLNHLSGYGFPNTFERERCRQTCVSSRLSASVVSASTARAIAPSRVRAIREGQLAILRVDVWGGGVFVGNEQSYSVERRTPTQSSVQLRRSCLKLLKSRDKSAALISPELGGEKRDHGLDGTQPCLYVLIVLVLNARHLHLPVCAFRILTMLH